MYNREWRGGNMILYIFRHGISENSNSEGDQARRLTDKGRKKVKEVMKFVKNKINPAVILTSPYTRAVQTAEIAAKVLDKKNAVELCDGLLPRKNNEDTLSELAAREESEIMIVGHNPHLSHLASDVTSSGKAEFKLKKASVTCIGFEGLPGFGTGTVHWMITPGILGL
jgi:phosphohistidine phosphatase